MLQVPTPEDWLIDELRPKTVIGADPHLIPNALWESWERKLYNASIELKAIPNNLIDQFWTKTAFPSYEAYNVPLNYTGRQFLFFITPCFEVFLFCFSLFVSEWVQSLATYNFHFKINANINKPYISFKKGAI